jgi:histidyl-tRNA synthetase
MASTFQPLPGFRDFAPRERAMSRYLFETWTRVAGRYGFVEYEAPILEAAELYLKKSGGELSTQLFRFEDQGGRDVVLRPELTASLARIVGSQQRDYPKPLKWFEIGRCFRYEKPQKGRLREFYQFNADILGESSAAADAELIALSIDVMRELGFRAGEFVIRLSDREVWQTFCETNNIEPDKLDAFLQVIDKLERDGPEKSAAKLAAFGVDFEVVEKFCGDPANASDKLKAIAADLEARGLAEFTRIDLSIVRGLAYYSGIVFEIFDARKSMRAVAGGGRYDDLLATLSDGSTDLPATGFAMGDAVIANLIGETAVALGQFQAWQQRQSTCDVYVVIADEAQRLAALGLIKDLRDAGIRVDFPLAPVKINKQFKQASASLARFAVVVGSEFPELKLKNLGARSEESIPPNAKPAELILARLTEPDGPHLA